MTRKRTVFLLGVMAFTLLWMSVVDVCGQDYGARLGGRRGGEVTFEPKGPGVLFGALDPAVRKWYVPQELYQEYQWKSWEYTNYARTLYERYVDTALEGDYFYDLYGNFVTRGWLIYDWSQQQPQQFGSSVYKDNRYSNWFSRVLIASDSKGQYHYAITIGDQLRTTLTPMTFSKPSYNGLQWDFLSDKYAATLLLSRISSPGFVSSIPTARTNNTNLMAGRVTAQVGDFVTVGMTYVNGHQSQTLLDSFVGSPFTGMLTDDQNGAPASWIEIVLSDDSPEDGEGGAAYFRGGSDIIIKDIHGEVFEGKQIGFEPIIEGGFQRVGFLAADGEETIRIRYDFTDPSYNGPDKTEIREVAFKLVLANDYRVQVTSDRQTNDENQPVQLLVTRASGNVKDNSNQRIVKFDYGLATATQIFGFTLEVTDIMGFNLYAEFDINHNYRQYPNVNFETHPTASGIVGDTESEAWMANLSKIEYPWFFFAEAFSMDGGYTTDIFLVDDTGALDYEGHAHRTFVGALLVKQPVFPEGLTVIGGVNNRGLVPEPLSFQLPQDAPDHLIHTGNHAQVSGDRASQHVFGDFPQVEGRLEMPERRVQRLVRKVCVVGQVKIVGVVHVVESFRHAVGPVRKEQANVESPGSALRSPALAAQVLQGPIAYDTVVVVKTGPVVMRVIFVVGGVLPNPGIQKVLALVRTGIARQPGGKRRVARVDGPRRAPFHDLVVGETPVLVGAAEIHLAQHGGGNAGLVEAPGPGHLPLVQGHADHPAVDLVHVLAGNKAHPAGSADRRVAVGPRKIGSLRGQPIQIRGFDERVALSSG